MQLFWGETGMLDKPRNRKVAAALAFAGAVAPIGAGLHKFYVGQPLWGILYLLLSMTPIPRVASAIEGVWYLTQGADEFDLKFNEGVVSTVKVVSSTESVDPGQISAVADAVRQLDQLRADGLISEYEFEQKRRQLLDRIT
jgi:TM2 domain-containing membrane protein YozV